MRCGGGRGRDPGGAMWGALVRPFSLLCGHTIWQPGPSEEEKINSAILTFMPLSASDHFHFHKEAKEYK